MFPIFDVPRPTQINAQTLFSQSLSAYPQTILKLISYLIIASFCDENRPNSCSESRQLP
jgi:hypothetical protein